MAVTTPQDLALAQASLVREASLALPGEFTQCTYDLGVIVDHEQIELFPKRHFRCDCPTSGLPHPCSLRSSTQTLPLNTENTYSQNYFRGGRFCRCSQTYDAKRERETMVQCLACEDWFHESCLNLRDRVAPRELDDDAQPPPAQNEDEDDASSACSSASLPPALLPGDTYETLICGSCVRENPTLKRYAGTKGFRMVVPSEEGFKILGEEWEEQEQEEVDVVGQEEEPKATGTKRRASGADEQAQAPKRARANSPNPSESTPSEPATSRHRCTAPPINPLAQTTLADPVACGDVFLSAGWRERWCRCETCYPSILKHPFLLEEEETYEPPRDPDAGLSLEELGMRALATLPHERALDSIRAYNAMRDDLMLYLRPFADSGREVREEDITAFFQRRRQGAGKGSEPARVM
ncbi:unnamed protein product [Rhizoctonia solani]|uniref:Zinc finger PHD-type domain-containing protein n=1 Tax=Rhizoctonia solani TaxID=456999 RepID=A0A8H2X9X4_9AGAM|nr:unnamed protein product [Rhizoctonia solani]